MGARLSDPSRTSSSASESTTLLVAAADASSESQAWGSGRHHVSNDDRKDLKRARREGRMAEAMLDRRAKMKR